MSHLSTVRNHPSIALRPFGPECFAELMTWFPDEAALIQWGGPQLRFPLDETQLDAMLAEGRPERSHGALQPPRRRLWTGYSGERMIGHAQVALDWRHGVARLARVAIAPEARGERLAHPFLVKVIDPIFDDPRFERLELNVYTFNETAVRTYVRLGFVHEGTRRSAVKVGAERWHTAIYAMLREERPAR